MRVTNAIMPPYAPLQFLTLLTFSTSVLCQFEFNDVQIVYDFMLDAVPICEVSCVAILRPPDENPAQKSFIDRLTLQLAKEYTDLKGDAINRRPSVMSYTTDLYEKFYMNTKKRQEDTCIFWITIVMVNNSTNKQLASLSESYYFNYPFWLLFANRSEIATVLQNIKIRLNTKLFVIRDEGNGRLNATSFGRFGETVGFLNWTKEVGLTQISPGIYPEITGLTLNVGTLVFPPHVIASRNQSGQITSVTGFYGALWNDIQETLKFNSVYIEPEGCIIGTYNENGNWSGLYRLIARREADVLLNGLTLSTERHHIADFLHPTEKTKYKLFYEKSTEIFDWLKVFRPLAYPVWIALVIWIVVGGIAAYLLTTVEKNFQKPRRHFSLISCIYFVLRSLCNQGSEQVPKLWALRIFFITSYLIAALILPSYSASLISALTVKTPIEPLKELTDVLATDLEISIESNSTDYDFFEKSSDPIFQKIFKTSVIKYNGYQIEFKESIEKACINHNTLFFGTLNELEAIFSDQKFSCELLPLKSTISPAYQAMAVAKHSEYRLILKAQILRMIEFGLLDRSKRLFLSNLNREPLEKDIGIGLIDVGAIFIYFGMLIALSAGIFCLELFSVKHHRKKHVAPYRATMKQKYINLDEVQAPNLKFLILEDFKKAKLTGHFNQKY